MILLLVLVTLSWILSMDGNKVSISERLQTKHLFKWQTWRIEQFNVNITVNLVERAMQGNED